MFAPACSCMCSADSPHFQNQSWRSCVKSCLPIFAAAIMVGCGGSPTLLTNKAGTGNGSTSSTSLSTSNNAQGTILADLQRSNGWTGYALLPPGYGICGSCSASGPQTTWSSSQGVNSPSLSGQSMQFTIGG